MDKVKGGSIGRFNILKFNFFIEFIIVIINIIVSYFLIVSMVENIVWILVVVSVINCS